MHGGLSCGCGARLDPSRSFIRSARAATATQIKEVALDSSAAELQFPAEVTSPL